MPSAGEHLCPWCSRLHDGRLVLCEACEQEAIWRRTYNGMGVRAAPMQEVKSEPDD